MATKKAVKTAKQSLKSVKKKDWLEQQADEINEAFADELSKLTAEDIPRITGQTVWPKVTIGSHSIRREYEDGRVELVTDWDALARDVKNAVAEYERKQLVDAAPYHPGYEGAVVANYEPDDGPLTDKQVKQIKKTAPKPKLTRKK